MSTGVVHNVLFGQRARLPLSWLKPVDCHYISFGTSIRTTATLSACGLVWALLLQSAFCLRRFRPMAIHSYLLARNVLAPFWSRTALLELKKKIKKYNNISHLTVLSDI